jgi:hypothetical protein
MTPIPDEPSTKLVPYKTSDTPFAAYLHYLSYKLVGSVQDPNDYKREVVIFVYNDEIPDLEVEWRAGKVVGDLKKYHRSLKIINRFVNEARKNRDE